MELRIPAAELSRALSMVQGIVQRKNTMPILANVLLEVKNSEDGTGRVVLSATDLDIGIRTERPCEVLQDGAVTILAKELGNMVKVLPGPDVSLKRLQNQQVEIKSGRTKAKLLALSADDFPQLSDFEDVAFVELDAALFADMVQKTVYSASTDESRYNLTGVYFEPQAEDPSHLVMVSTDGHRLSRIERRFEGAQFNLSAPVILPRKGLSELLRLLSSGNDTETFELGFTENQAIARRGDTVLSMRLIDGNFPDYKQVIPKVSDKIVKVDRKELLASLKRVSVLASDKTSGVKVAIGDDQIVVTCKNPDAGEVTDDIPAVYEGSELELAFNARYVVESLASLDDNNVTLKLTDSLSPALLMGADEPGHLTVIMPMRI